MICVVAACALAANSALAGPHRKRDAALQNVSGDSVRVIVQTRAGALDRVATKARGRGQSIRRLHRLINAAALTVSRASLDALEADENVTAISLDSPVAATADVNSTAAAIETNTLIATLGVPDGGYTGRGVGVAVIDSGLELSSDFPSYRFYDFVNGRTFPYDDYGHGTHVAGLIGGRGALSNGVYVGVAPRTRIIALKVLDAKGQGRTSTIIQAIEFAIANRSALGIDVINLSLGHPPYESPDTDPLVQAVEAAVRAGMVVVTSAGNVGANPSNGNVWHGGVLSPGNAPSAITVGAVDTKNTTSRADDTIPNYSSRGPTRFSLLAKPDIAAPGHALVSDAALNGTLYKKYPQKRVKASGFFPRHLRLNGTSMSAAVTSGVVALMVEANRSKFASPLTPNAVKALLEYSALPIADADALSQGRGELNASGAVGLAASVDPSTAAREWWLVNGVQPSTQIGSDDLAWAQTVVWGNTVLYGNSVFLNEPAWAQTVVWGNSDDTVVWGNDDTVVWGNSDDTVVWGNSDDTVVWGNSTAAATDDTVVWGNSTAAATDDTVVWGNSTAAATDDTVVWGNSTAATDDTVVWGNSTSASDPISTAVPESSVQ